MTTFYEFQQMFPDDEACLKQIMIARYGGTELDCPKCGCFGKFYRMTKERGYVCQHCGHHLHPCVGTPMERSRTPLHKWFLAMFMFTNSRHGVVAKELQRQLGVTYKCAWRMAHEIRKYMAEVDGEHPLDGEVEVDETLVGGKVRGQGRGYRGNKTTVMAMAQRDGDVMTKVVPDVKRRTLLPIVQENVEQGSKIYSDELKSYATPGKAGYEHSSVNHSVGEYVRGACHVNSVEGFWARLKNSIRGAHVHVSGKHLQKYAKEFEYRYNRRKRPERMFADLVENL